jgi:hypothetical protein
MEADLRLAHSSSSQDQFADGRMSRQKFPWSCGDSKARCVPPRAPHQSPEYSATKSACYRKNLYFLDMHMHGDEISITHRTLTVVAMAWRRIDLTTLVARFLQS